mmetsp:Transcript_47655/g.152723  ORF Transcript_47655/g.152723 Transcript_47655/m.152723 type:complete len:210 (-) Transcript_47655:237-866(-)
MEVPAAARNGATIALANVLMAMPASADAGKIFDFNLTAPIMAAQFVLLMVFLDKFWFTPVGKTLDDRDGMIRSQLSNVKGNAGEIAEISAKAESIIGAARADAQKAISDAKSKTEAETAATLAATKAKIDAELATGIAQLKAQKEETLKVRIARCPILAMPHTCLARKRWRDQVVASLPVVQDVEGDGRGGGFRPQRVILPLNAFAPRA